MQEFKYTITDPEGIHARPAGELVKKSNEFKSNITVTKDGRTVDAKRIFGVMSLKAKQGEEIIINAEGEDEQKAIEAISDFLGSNM